jgi:hypothetical protein
MMPPQQVARLDPNNREASLYAPVKRFLESLGFDVKGEICGCDLVALRGDEPPLVVVGELKLGFNLELVLQGINRTAACDEIWLAVRTCTRAGRERDPRVRELCRLLGFGLLGVSSTGRIEVLVEPGPWRPRRDPKRRSRLVKEHRRRLGDPALGGHVGGLGAVKHREFAMASGEMTSAEFAVFLATIFAKMTEVSIDGAIHFVCMDWRHMSEVLAAAKGSYSELNNLCVWNKNNGGMGSFYRSKHELVFVYKVGTAPHINTIELGKSGRYRTNVGTTPASTQWRAGRDSDLEMHPTVKPTALVIDAIKDCSRRGDVVLDPFSGSGTTIIAAQKCGRRARTIYVDVAVRRWQAFTGLQATLDITGETFAEVEAQRGDPLS